MWKRKFSTLCRSLLVSFVPGLLSGVLAISSAHAATTTDLQFIDGVYQYAASEGGAALSAAQVSAIPTAVEGGELAAAGAGAAIGGVPVGAGLGALALVGLLFDGDAILPFDGEAPGDVLKCLGAGTDDCSVPDPSMPSTSPAFTPGGAVYSSENSIGASPESAADAAARGDGCSASNLTGAYSNNNLTYVGSYTKTCPSLASALNPNGQFSGAITGVGTVPACFVNAGGFSEGSSFSSCQLLDPANYLGGGQPCGLANLSPCFSKQQLADPASPTFLADIGNTLFNQQNTTVTTTDNTTTTTNNTTTNNTTTNNYDLPVINITPQDVTDFEDANPTVPVPTVQDVVGDPAVTQTGTILDPEPAPEPTPITTSVASGGTGPANSTPPASSSSSCGGSGDPCEVDWGPAAAPANPSGPTYADAFGPLFSMFPSLSSWTAPQHTGECPNLSFYSVVLGTTISTASFCSSLAQLQPYIGPSMLVVFTLASLLIILGA